MIPTDNKLTKVKELIEILQQFDPDLPVWVTSGYLPAHIAAQQESGPVDVRKIEINGLQPVLRIQQ